MQSCECAITRRHVVHVGSDTYPTPPPPSRRGYVLLQDQEGAVRKTCAGPPFFNSSSLSSLRVLFLFIIICFFLLSCKCLNSARLHASGRWRFTRHRRPPPCRPRQRRPVSCCGFGSSPSRGSGREPCRRLLRRCRRRRGGRCSSLAGVAQRRSRR